MQEIIIREATRKDQFRIWWMVWRAGLDPTALHWSHFLIAEHNEKTVGIGQIRPAAYELGSLVVHPQYRGQGIGGKLIREFVHRANRDVYLECAAQLVPYYAKHGFIEISPAQAPAPLRRKAIIGSRIAGLFGQRLAVMKRSNEQ